ncbi:MAG: endonuclease/exonuclease/phosphatase family protein [Bacteroidota bacterium]
MKFLLPLGLGLALLSCQPASTPNPPADLPDFAQQATAQPVDFSYPDHDTVTVLSWNVEHFVDAWDNPYINHPREDSALRMEGREAQLLTALGKANADVVVLQEFESKAFAKQLASQVPELGYRWFAGNESPNWYMNVVVMSRLPLGSLNGYGSVTTPLVDWKDEEGQRETQNQLNTRMLTVEVLARPGKTIYLTGLHLKAGRGPRNEAMRLGQVEYLKSQFARVRAADPEGFLLVAGDLNCTPASDEFQALLRNDTGPGLVDPWAADSSVYSHPADQPQWRIDHLLASQNLSERMLEPTQYRYFFDTTQQRALADHLPAMGTFLLK